MVLFLLWKMMNTSKGVKDSTRTEIIDKFAQKMLNSGHSLEVTRRNIMSGMKAMKEREVAQECQGEQLSQKNEKT